MAQPHSKKLVVVGGGAAGFFCAVNAARFSPGLEVIVLEKSSKVLSKVKVSGGGRCNVTHHCFSIADMTRCYPRGQQFLKKAFRHFFTLDTIDWFRERGVVLKTESDGRVFPVSDSSQTIVDCLLQEANCYQVKLQLNAEVQQLIPPSHESQQWKLKLRNGTSLEADAVCVAAGGFSKPEHFNWLTELDHHIETPVPSLFTFNIPGDSITNLMGVSVHHVRVKINGYPYVAEGPMLITHWGLSGPAILRLSAFAARDLATNGWHCTVQVNWAPDEHETSARSYLHGLRATQGGRKLVNTPLFGLPKRLWEYLLQVAVVDGQLRWADLPGDAQNRLAKTLCAQTFSVKGKTTFKEEFVTAGGILTEEINPSTMESRKVPGLFFAGEVLNVDGITGGYNFQHAWTSGWIAAKGMCQFANVPIC